MGLNPPASSLATAGFYTYCFGEVRSGITKLEHMGANIICLTTMKDFLIAILKKANTIQMTILKHAEELPELGDYFIQP